MSNYLKRIGDLRYHDPVTVDFNLDVQDIVLPEGKYRMRYCISDMLDRTYNSDFVNFTWDGSKAVFEALLQRQSVMKRRIRPFSGRIDFLT